MKFFLPFRKVLLFVTLTMFFMTLGCDSGYSESPGFSSEKGQSVAMRGRPTIGSPAPPFRLTDLQGKSVALSDFKGQVVLLNFWATWCGPCRVEMPAMEALYKAMHAQGLEILAVSVDQQGMAVTKPFQESMGLTFPILHDSDYRVGLEYGARTLPMTFAIDRKGIIRHRIFGARDWNSSEARTGIAQLLQESYQPPTQTM